MTDGASTAAAMLEPDFARRLYKSAHAEHWGLSEEEFVAALRRSAAHRFATTRPSPREFRDYLAALHIEDLALACACAAGREAAWEHFVRNFRPILRAVARSAAPPDVAHELADSLYAELFGVEERNGIRRSLFEYFHGRSSLVGWLRVVLAQRAIDRAREHRRLDPLSAAEGHALPASGDPPADPVDRARHLPLVRSALGSALAGLASRDRLRLALYYTQQLKLAAVGRILGESEATVSRKLERTRRDVRAAVERQLRECDGLSDTSVAACFEFARSDPAFDLARALPAEPGGWARDD